MTNHLHLIIGTKKNPIEDIVRDFKSFTSRRLRKVIECHPQESRKEWILKRMYQLGSTQNRNKDYQLWQYNYHPIELYANYLVAQKLEYIHQNPVKAGFVNKAEDYLYSSAKNHAGLQSVIDLDC